ncbi:hypothetical protein GIB67_007698 [Kingdonia uniflora]|uniref:Uncharacterized protein n=1 Tax=Kingdonia uniflora TaxID=39325 RepID=A0A7J7N1R9_9MAGN|nr:hypothetical protein GIB67_007698 [Kingdonia uniflora]
MFGPSELMLGDLGTVEVDRTSSDLAEVSRLYERISMDCLEDARKSFGTDEDLLLISLENKAANKLSP